TIGVEQDRTQSDVERPGLQARAASLAAEEERQADVCTAARDRLTQLRSRLESLPELEARSEGCTRGVASLLARVPPAATLLAGVLRVPAGLERAGAAVLA